MKYTVFPIILENIKMHVGEVLCNRHLDYIYTHGTLMPLGRINLLIYNPQIPSSPQKAIKAPKK